eukprot:scaffold84611_cov48-Cyclotella_meneghiniana.AAC.1
MAFHDLTPEKSAPPNCKQLFGLGSKFIPTPSKQTGRQDLEKAFTRFDRDFRLRVHFAGDDSDSSFEEAPHKSKLYVKSKWTPPDRLTPSWVLTRVNRFFRELEKLFKRKTATSNLTQIQQQFLDLLPSDPTYLFPETDKGLGPCAVTFIQYIEGVLVHLLNEEVYEQLTTEEALLSADVLHADITEWLHKYERVIGKHAYRFISRHINSNMDSTFGQFYILYKIHKGIGSDGKWPNRPVSSDVTSFPHALGKWVTEALLPIQSEQKSYFKDSFRLKAILDKLAFAPNALPLRPADYAKSECPVDLHADFHSQMNYANFPAALVTNVINQYKVSEQIREINTKKASPKSAMDFDVAMEDITENVESEQPPSAAALSAAAAASGHATPPSPSLPSTTQPIPPPPKADDVFGIWLTHEDPVQDKLLWDEFCRDMDSWHGLRWKCEAPSRSVNFMDLTITIVNGRLETTLFEKAMNLYLYLPPHSSHPRGRPATQCTGDVIGKPLTQCPV